MPDLCRVPRCYRPELGEGLCAAHFATEYGPLGLDDMPPRWAIEEEPMTATIAAPAFVCEGWYDANQQHHACNTENPTHQSKGRCGKCYSREYAANQKVRPPQHTERPNLTVVPATACIGWDGSDGTHHECKFPEEIYLDNRLRCQKCARMQKGADTAATMTKTATPPAPRTAPQEAPQPPTATTAPPTPSDTPLVANVPILRSRHIRPVMSFAVVCANCDGPLVQGDHQTIASYVGKSLACRECGASWRVEPSTLGEHTERHSPAA